MNRADVKRRECELWGNALLVLVMWLFGRMIGDQGILYTGLSAEFIYFFWRICGESFSDILGKMIRVRNAKGQFRNVLNIRRIAVVAQLILGAAFSGIAFLLSSLFCDKVIEQHYCLTIILILCPTLLIRNISAYICGIIQGDGSHLPSAISYIVRPFLVVSFGFLFVNMLHNYGLKVSALLRQSEFSGMYGGIGIAIAALVTEVFIMIYLMLINLWRKHSFRVIDSEGLKTVDPLLILIRNLYGNSYIKGMINMLIYLPVLITLSFLLRFVDAIETVSLWYGSYFIVLAFFIQVINAFATIPQCGGCHYLIKKDYKTSRLYLQTTIHITLVLSFFITAILVALSGPITELISPAYSGEIARLFMYGAFYIIFASVSIHLSEFVVAAGSKLLVLLLLLFKNVGLFFLLRLMIVNLNLGLLGATNALIIVEVVYCLVVGVVLFGINRFYFDWGNMVLIPAVAASISGVLCVLVSKLLGPHLGAGVTVIVCLILDVMLYGVVLVITRNIRENELKLIPLGGFLGFFSRSFSRF